MLKITNDGLTGCCHWMLYNCNHMAIVSVKGLRLQWCLGLTAEFVCLTVCLLKLMQDEATEARASDVEPMIADQQDVSDTGTEAPSSSTVAPSSSLNNDEIASGYRYGLVHTPPVSYHCRKRIKFENILLSRILANVLYLPAVECLICCV